MKKLFIFFLLSVTVVSCVPDEESDNYALPFIYTLPAHNVTLTGATLAGNVEESPLSIGSMSEGVQSTIQSKGFIWSDKPNVSFENGTKVTLDGTFGKYSATITSLKSNTKYYYKAYASNPVESTFGEEMSFTTSGEAPCSYTTDNYLSTISKNRSLDIDEVNFTVPSGYMDGNLRFRTRSYFSNASIDIVLNERDDKWPASGNYNAVYDFDSQSLQSSNEAVIYVYDPNDSYTRPQGGQGDPTNTKFYIQNDGKKITFIFCNTKIEGYILNGKYSYVIPK